MRAANEHRPRAGALGLRKARRAALASAICAALAGSARVAQADPAGAEALFQAGRRLLQQGELDEACELLTESQRLDPSSGTLINLADCHERQGKTATAWAEFLGASRLAVLQKNTTRADEAGRRAALLESRLSYMTVRVAAPPPGLKVLRDGEPLHGVQQGARLPVDPGLHTIVAEAPGYQTLHLSVLVKPDGDHARVWVPPLWDERSGPSAPPGVARPAAPSAPPPGRPIAAPEAPAWRPVVGYTAAGFGALSLGVGAFFGLKAMSTNHHAERACASFDNCSPRALEERRDANVEAWVANVGIGLGAASLALGGYLLFLEASKPATPQRVGAGRGLWLASGPGRLALIGRF
ncbi:MAG: hypothetical protein MUF34_00340 [Polyangiaceae bacterium]|nr:hypothetical protein [Polyangiaceae bacterium]